MHRRYVFIDESGDFGFSSKSSRHITLSAIVVSDRVALERIPKRMRKQLGKNAKTRPELKFHKSDDSVKRKVLNSFFSLPNAKVVCVVADKGKVSSHYRSHRNEMYDHMCSTLLESVLRSLGRPRELDLYFDIRPRNKPKNREFDSMVITEIQRHCQEMRIIAPSVFISRVSSETNPGLVVADFIAGAIQRKHEHRSLEYYDLISKSILVEKQWI